MFKMEFCFFFKYFDISMQAAAACLLLNRNRVFLFLRKSNKTKVNSQVAPRAA